MSGEESARPASALGLIPTWQGNLLFFGLLVVTVVAYFLWQIQQAQRLFVEDVQDHARLVAAVVRLHASGALLSQEVIEEVLLTFMGNTARFVDYLDSVEPFTPDELASFAAEAGLAGIRIVREDGGETEGPVGWRKGPPPGCDRGGTLEHRPADHLYLYTNLRKGADGCVVVGVAATRIEDLQLQIGLAGVLNTLTGLPGIRYIRLENETAGGPPAERLTVTFRQESEGRIAEVRQALGAKGLVVGLDAAHLSILLNRLWRDFFVFSTLLVLLGALLSWLLYRQQRAHLAEIQAYEREISQQREDAALGRTAAAIAHEIRNPLNAISVGLQRLQMEIGDLDPEHRRLLVFVLDAVRRTDGIVGGLLSYARPQAPKQRPVNMAQIVEGVLALYRQRCEDLGIDVAVRQAFEGPVSADPDLIGQVVENLVKNAVEAQPHGGVLHVDLSREGEEALLRIRNRGLSLPPEDAGRVLEPYFTTKTRGTGLGLAICRKIVRAHGGRIGIRVPEADMLEITVRLPIAERPRVTTQMP